VQSVLFGDPLSGDLFVFKNRRGDRLKIPTWMGDGFALYLRRLERGTFAFPAASACPPAGITPLRLAILTRYKFITGYEQDWKTAEKPLFLWNWRSGQGRAMAQATTRWTATPAITKLRSRNVQLRLL